MPDEILYIDVKYKFVKHCEFNSELILNTSEKDARKREIERERDNCGATC